MNIVPLLQQATICLICRCVTHSDLDASTRATGADGQVDDESAESSISSVGTQSCRSYLVKL